MYKAIKLFGTIPLNVGAVMLDHQNSCASEVGLQTVGLRFSSPR